MPKIPRICCREAVAAFEKAGFEKVRQSSSHVILKKAGHRFGLSIPEHKGKTLGVGLLKSQIMNAGLTVEQFIDLLQK